LLAVVPEPLVAFSHESVQEAASAGATFTGATMGCA
jgi:hypothetical protein